MTFLNPALLLLGELAKNLAQMLPKLSVKNLTPTLRYENYMIFALPSGVA
jgi:hypothetical protein